jgi:hypothetical protein
MPADEIPADAASTDLRTSNNTLSWWECSHTSTDVSEVVLAIASSMKVIEGMHLVLLPKVDVANEGVDLQVTPEHARIPIVELRHRHFDFANLTVGQVYHIAKKITASLQHAALFHSLTRRQVLDILCDAVSFGRLSLHDLDERARGEVQNRIRQKRAK